MAANIYRVAIVGASSLAGKELSSVLSDSPMASASFALFDEDEAVGQLAAAGDEISFVRTLDDSSFEGMDLVFFAGDAAAARKHLAAARKAGADVIDLTGGLETAPGATIGCAGLKQGNNRAANDPRVVIAAHPAAQMLAAIATQLQAEFGLKSVAATVMLSASEFGRAAVDELHRQTISLLGFQPIPQEQYDAQVAFNLVNEFGEAARITIDPIEKRIHRHFLALMPQPSELSLQVVQAPIFHGIAASIFAELLRPATTASVQQPFIGTLSQTPSLQQIFELNPAPTPVSVSGTASIAVHPRLAEDEAESLRVRVWSASDNLRLLATNAMECSLALRIDAPSVVVQ